MSSHETKPSDEETRTEEGDTAQKGESSTETAKPTAPSETPASALPKATRVKASNKSTRPWKQPQKRRFSAAKATHFRHSKGSGVAFRVQQAQKAAMKLAKSKQEELREELRSERKSERERLETRKRQREENEARNTVYQVISNPDKVKKMNKKQLRSVKRMRVNERGATEFVSPWEK